MGRKMRLLVSGICACALWFPGSTSLLAQTRAPDCFELTPTISGSSGPDFLTGTPGGDVISAGDGDDVILGGGGNDVLCGGDGNDLVAGGKGIDFVVGDGGADTLRGDAGTDWLFDVDPTLEPPMLLGLVRQPVDQDQDILLGGSGADLLAGEGGDDFLDGGMGPDIVHGLSVSDPLIVDLGAGRATSAVGGIDTLVNIEHVIGGPASDAIVGDDGDNLLYGLAGADRVFGAGGEDVVYATLQGSFLAGGGDPGDLLWVGALEPARVDLAAGTARSLERSGASPDVLHGFQNVLGTPFDDVLIGDLSENELGGVGGSDRLIGSAGDDVLLGDGPDYARAFYEEGRAGGRDFLDGGAGSDKLNGGPRRDGCVNGEKEVSCESDVAPEDSDCTDPDPDCSWPLRSVDPRGVLTILLGVSEHRLDPADVRWMGRMLSRF